MPRFAANLSLLYPEFALRDRIDAAARDGFAAVEVQAPYAVPPAEFRRALDAARVQLVLMNAPAGAENERGLAALPGRETAFEATLHEALDYARRLGAPRVHVLAGIPDPAMSAEACVRVYQRNIEFACDLFAPAGIDVMIEPINTRDMPGYFLSRPQQAAEVIAALRKSNLGLQFDFYHLQIMRGDLARTFLQHRPIVRHVQIAGAPDRHEPDHGEIHYPYLFDLLDQSGYRGWVGCEYRPRRAGAGGTTAGLAWLRAAALNPT